MHTLRALGVAAAAMLGLSLLSPVAARAEVGRAWTAAKANLPGDATTIVAADVAAAAKSAVFAQLLPRVLSSSDDAGKVLELARTACKLEPLTAIRGVVAVSDASSTGALYIGLAGLDQAKLASCAQAVWTARGDSDKLTFSKGRDGVVEVASDKRPDKQYYGWIGNDVVVIAKSGDKAQLQRWMGGKGAFAKSPLGAIVAKANTRATVWLATTEGRPILTGVDMKRGHGALTFAKSEIGAELHAALTDAKMATSAAEQFNTQLAEAKQSPMLPAPIASVLKTLTVVAAGDELVIKVSAPEGDVMKLVEMALAMSGRAPSSASAPPPPAPAGSAPKAAPAAGTPPKPAPAVSPPAKP